MAIRQDGGAIMDNQSIGDDNCKHCVDDRCENPNDCEEGDGFEEQRIDLITEKEEFGDNYVNDLTREMDKYLLYPDNHCGSPTYIYANDINKNRMAIRYPGATRGGISLDENRVITDIQLYDDTCFDAGKHGVGVYKPEMKEAVQKFIGMKIIVRGDGFEDVDK